MTTLIKPKKVLRIGIVGPTSIAEAEEQGLTVKLRSLLRQIASAAERCFSSPTASRLYQDGEPELRFLSNFAPGVDQLGTREAHGLGYRVTALLPMPMGDYARSLGDASRGDASLRKECFEHRLSELHPDLRVLELPEISGGFGNSADDSYAFAARMLTDHVDLLVAVWAGPDGERGRVGGTSLVVRGIQYAQDRNVPIVWVLPDAAGGRSDQVIPPRFVDSFVGGGVFDAQAPVHARAGARATGTMADELSRRLRVLLDPFAPAVEVEPAAGVSHRVGEGFLKGLREFVEHLGPEDLTHTLAKRSNDALRAEHFARAASVLTETQEKRSRVGTWYVNHSPLARVLRRAHVRVNSVAPRLRESAFGGATGTGGSSLDRVREPVEKLSSDLMARYRASFSWIFVLGAAAVLFAVTAFLFKSSDAWKWLGKTLAVVELVVISSVIVLHVASHTRQWQQRALDLRMVAELLRQAASVSRAWLLVPRPLLTATGHVRGPGEPPPWPQWYAQAILRDHDFGLEHGTSKRMTRHDLVEARDQIRDELVVQQRDWYGHKWKVHRIGNSRLHRFNVRWFAMVLLACSAALLLAFQLPVTRQGDWAPALAVGVLVTITAAFPAMAAAAHGISAQGELGRIALAYERMEATLESCRLGLDALDEDMTFADLQAEVSQASIAMLAEVQDWHRSYGMHPPPIA